MRRRQIYALQKQNLTKHYIGGPIVVAEPDTEPLPPPPVPERRGWCPKCKTYIGRGVFYHVRACNGEHPR